MYKLYKTFDNKNGAYIVNLDGSITSFIFDNNNQDYQEYLKWLEEGNTPLPADEISE